MVADNDKLYGGPGDDVLFAGDGRDSLISTGRIRTIPTSGTSIRRRILSRLMPWVSTTTVLRRTSSTTPARSRAIRLPLSTAARPPVRMANTLW
ncbi:hypothetical protein [Bradyrhizobium jicamae]|uniref:hypothetical protein n=1 Tax=Bradyrhizobium jicamae TaxID=280332 RepID=UPI001FD9EA82|nr:hypothetical protein [Bradyrhizobium jicamae]